MSSIEHNYHGKLSVSAYINENEFKNEQLELFGKSWVFAGVEKDIENVGDYFTIKIGLNPIFVIRAEDNSLKAFHNLCKHRGTQLLRSKGKSKKIINCPYHNWSYSLDGKVITIPNKSSFNQEKVKGLGLRKASIEIWNGMIFINSDPNAESFQKWMGKIDQFIGIWDLKNFEEYKSESKEYEVNANWKSVVENFMDVYHLGHLHHDTLKMYDHKNIQEFYSSYHWSSFDPLKKEYYKDYGFEEFPEPVGAYVHHLFPTLGLSESEDGTISMFIVEPIGAEKTNIKLRNFYDPENYEDVKGYYWESLKYFSKSLMETNKKSEDPLESGDFMIEDIYVVEQQQKAMYSPFFEVGAMSSLEKAIINFQEQVLKFMSVNNSNAEKASESSTNEEKIRIIANNKMVGEVDEKH